ncbi:tyrosine-type recombinase/integrase [Tunturibacter empetritectus]|uniref:Integrase n=1 Tax=Tunturiibacter empetritectus TaxID=3069691 RepID=A0A7W8MQF6_9BACT|nr:site-specific integrase [Edaphobacter lichenicola]MBB5316676.1 integrase [Edaphobacter lichenicola]
MARGVYEHPAGSGIWWIHYYAGGKRHREKVGRKSDATKLYQTRKADAIAGRKLPELRDSRVLHFSELIDDALEYVADHKDRRSYISKAEIVRKAIGSRPAAEITPQELERWLRSHCKTAATTNRYKAFISLCYREGLHNGKVTVNPARQVRHRRESVGRLRFLSRDEYDTLHEAIKARFPEHLAEFIVSVNTGMRLSEQYSLTWGQVHLDRRTIDLTKTKNGSARTVHLNADAVAALKTRHKKNTKPTDMVFPRQGPRFDTRSWFVPSLEDAKVSGYVWHSNRHTFCSWLAMAGASIKEIQELAGHKTITMSARYSHLSPEHRLSVIDRIASSAGSG